MLETEIMEEATITVSMSTLLCDNNLRYDKVADVEWKTLAEVKKTRGQEGSGRITHLDVEIDHQELK